jgi:NAD+ synthase
LKVPTELIHKTPIDGLQPKSDEEKLGFTYHEVNELIRKGVKGQNYDKIKKMYVKNKFKTDIIRIPCYVPSPALPNYNINPIGSLL